MFSKRIAIVLIYLNLVGLHSNMYFNSNVNFKTRMVVDSNMECKCDVKNNEHDKTQYKVLTTKTELPNGQFEYTYEIDTDSKIDFDSNFNFSPIVNCSCDQKRNKLADFVRTEDTESSAEDLSTIFNPGKYKYEWK